MWLPGEVLQLEQALTERRAAKRGTIGKPLLSSTPSVPAYAWAVLVQHAARAAGVDPQVVDELVSSGMMTDA